ncbi:MAG: hydrogenase iron-sulfur subunit [Promethearchaeota archaeon]|nr:MAG: hydrogenase iron-sulfur subunit [Candidatus Lokiarchaeota archaeon]
MIDEDNLLVCICNCGETIELDFEEIKQKFSTDFPSAKLIISDSACSNDGIDQLLTNLKSGDYKGFLFVGCTPQIIEVKLELELRKNNLQNVFFEIANIREQCYWVHDEDNASYKAYILIKSHFEKLKHKKNEDFDIENIEKSVIIIGAGIGGLEVAINLQDLGYDITLIEKEKELGGFIRELPIIHPYNISGEEFIIEKLAKLDQDKIKIFKNWKVAWVDGKLGNYMAKIFDISDENNEKLIKGSIVVFTTGHDIFIPSKKDYFGYGKDDRVLSLYEFAKKLKHLNYNKNQEINELIPLKLFEGKESIKKILIIQCVGSRDKNFYDYCSKYCCTTAINYSIELLNHFSDLDIFISYIDIRTPWTSEYIYQEARDLGVNFIKGKVGSVEIFDDKLIATVYDSSIRKLLKLNVDLILLSTALTPNMENQELFEELNIKTWNKGFIKPKYAKLRNIETSRNGIFACGTATGPKLIEETINEANAISMEIMKILEQPDLFISRNITIIDPDKCNGCELCARICPFNIPYMIEREADSESKPEYLAVIDPFSCRGCGTCNAICPTAAAQLQNYSQDEIFAQITSILGDSDDFEKPIIIGFVCDECAYASVDILGLLRKKYPENIRLIRIPCGGRLSLLDILKSYNEGASGVFLLACGEDKCHYLEGNTKAKLHIEAAEEILESIGWEKGRTEYFTSFAADNSELYRRINNFAEKIKKMGNNPFVKSN